MRNTFMRLPRSAMEPLHIRAYLQSAVITDRTLPIDAVLYYAAMRERYGPQTITLSGGEHPNAATGVQLPLARCEEHGPMWYYAASFAQWPVHADGQDYWNKRLDTSLVSLIDWQGRKPRVDVSSGPYKSYHMPVFYRHALHVDWHLVGHRDSVERLLLFTTHLGKKVAHGWGSVLRWEIERTTDDWSVRGRDGELMRAVPMDGGVLTGFRPSYWLPKNQAACLMPDGYY